MDRQIRRGAISGKPFFQFAVGVLLFVAACAPASRMPKVDDALAEAEAEKQRELVMRQRYEDLRRLHRIAYPILAANAELCDDTLGTGSGLLVVTKDTFGEEYEMAAARLFDIRRTAKVIGVAENSAGAKAGFQEGDILVSLDDWSIPVGKDTLSELADKYSTLAEKQEEIAVTVLRGEETKQLSLHPEDVCGYGYTVSQENIVNAFADGDNIHIAVGMMRFAENDEELATVVGHEIAHNMMGHIQKQQGNAAAGLVVDLLLAGLGVNTQGAFSNMAGRAFSQEFEAEADYVGLYLMARAGFKVDDTPYFWRRMGVNHPAGIKANHASSHPATPYRFVALEKTVKEIKAKEAEHAALIPERDESPDTEGSESDTSRQGIASPAPDETGSGLEEKSAKEQEEKPFWEHLLDKFRTSEDEETAPTGSDLAPQ